MKKINMKIVLASKSPRRKAILEKEGFEVVVDPSSLDESSVRKSNVRELVTELAKLKASEVAERHENSLVLGSDTLVYFEGKEIGQQHNDKDAEKLLRALMGKTHDVYTGLYIINTKTKKALQDCVVSKVTLKNVSEKTLHNYVNSGQYKGKAGAYNVADPEFESFISKIEGSYTNIMGLPVEELKKLIKKVSR